MTRLGGALRALGGLTGGALGGVIGMPTSGSAAGTSLGAALSRWLGSGDYTVSSNSLVTKASTGVPMMHKDGQTIIVRHREFLTEVKGSTTFTVRSSFPINPGMAETFPWLSNIATQFQQYRIRGMVYHYIPTSGSIATSSPSLGSVMLQTVYRASDVAPSGKVELLNEYWSSEVVPSETFAHPVECNPAENPFNVQYVRATAPPAGESKLLYDLGTTYLAVSGQQANDQVLGDLWVTYEIELKKPVLYSPINNSNTFWAVRLDSPSNFFSGTQTNSEGNMTIGYTGAVMTLPSDLIGTYEIVLRLQTTGSGMVGSTPATVTAVGATQTAMVPSGSTINYAGMIFPGAAYMQRLRFVKTSPGTCTLTFSAFGTWTAASWIAWEVYRHQ
jgi:hypothetical protein